MSINIINKVIIANIFTKIDLCRNRKTKCNIKNVLVKIINLMKESKNDIHYFSNYIIFYCKIKNSCLCSLDSWNDIVYESNKYRIDLIKNDYIYCRCDPQNPHYYNVNRQCCQLLTPVAIYTSINYLNNPHEYINDNSNVVDTFIGCRKYADRYTIFNNNLLTDEDYPSASDDLVINKLNIDINLDKEFYKIENYNIKNDDIELYTVSYNWDIDMNNLELYQAASHKLLVNNTIFKIKERRLSLEPVAKKCVLCEFHLY